MLNDTTRRHSTAPIEVKAGLSPAEAIAIHVYKRPWYEKLAMLLFRWGWVLLLVLVFALTGCTGPSDYETDVIVAQDLQDAVMQARGER